MNQVLANTLIIIASFCAMEAVAWLSHRFLMHGLMWKVHQDHHTGSPHTLQRNDSFFLIFAVPSWLFIMFGIHRHRNYAVRHRILFCARSRHSPAAEIFYEDEEPVPACIAQGAQSPSQASWKRRRRVLRDAAGSEEIFPRPKTEKLIRKLRCPSRPFL
jgi:hypothetical protein